MKFFCEYCGNRIDAEVDEKCPNCGASYKKNKSFIELEKNRVQQNELNNEYKHKIINHVLGTMKFSKVFMLIPIIFFLIVFTTIIVLVLNFGNDSKKDANKFDNDTNMEKIEDKINSMFDEQTKEQEKVTVGFNEFAETEKYRVKVEKYEVVEDMFHHAGEGYELVKFHLIVENLSDTSIRSENVNCIVDGIAQTNDVYSGHSDLPFHIDKELAVKGTSTFFVPVNASSYDIRYGDYVTIHIEK